MEFTVAKIEHPTGDVLYVTPNKQCDLRVRSFFDKEPDTIAWISELNPGEVFVDVGANVGMYSLWAAKTTGARVFAFEPESQNFALLCQNILINRCDVMAYPLAVSDSTRIARTAPLYLSQFAPGGSCHTLGESVDFKGRPMKPAFVQGTCAVSLDGLWQDDAILPPDFIKIDVDGLEPAVIRGAPHCLENARSVLVELDINRPTHAAVIGQMEDIGFRWDKEQADKSRRKEGAFTGIGNVIFRR